MFNKNDYVNYSTNGICKIEDIRAIPFDANAKERTCYVLKPVYQNASTIFVPVDNDKLSVKMRPVLSAEEIDKIILDIKNQEMHWIKDRKKRMEKFQDILQRRDEKELLLLVSCLYFKSGELEKGLASTEEEILKKAENIVEQEFSFSLKISSDSIGNYIKEKLEEI